MDNRRYHVETTGIKVTDSEKVDIIDNQVSGYDTGVGIERGKEITVEGNVISTEPIPDDVIDKMKAVIDEQTEMKGPLKQIANSTLDQLRDEKDPATKNALFESVKALVPQVASGILVELAKKWMGM